MLEKYFNKFYNMKPYLLIEEDEWKDIMQKYEKEEVVKELAKVLHTYPAPLPKITNKQTLDSLNKLKGIKHNDVLVEKKWFPRNERKSNYHLNYNGSQFLLKRNNSGNKRDTKKGKKRKGNSKKKLCEVLINCQIVYIIYKLCGGQCRKLEGGLRVKWAG